MIELRVVQAFVVDAADLQSNPEIPGFVQPDVLVFEAEGAELCVQRAGIAVWLHDRLP